MYERNKRWERWPPKPGLGLYYDPLYGYIPLPEYVRRIMDVPIFQRTREIKQLSMVYLVYPGAIHTRFDHSIGVCHLATLVHRHLQDKIKRELKQEPDPPILDDVTLASLQLAALLHDIGHGPLGHVFEQWCRRFPDYREWNHETVARYILRGERNMAGELNESLREIGKSITGQGAPAELLTPENIYRISVGDKPGKWQPLDLREDQAKKYHFLTQIIPSAFGVDRLDYLRRDAYFSGVATGNIDIWEIISSMTLHRSDQGLWELKLEENSSLALEALLQTRNLTYRRLYFNPLNRAAQELLIRGLHASEYTPEKLALATDIDLLGELQHCGDAGRDFCDEVHARVRDRALYDCIRLTSHRALRNMGAAELSSYERPTFEEQIEVEKQLAHAIGLTRGTGKIFFDRELVPAVKIEDYTDPWFLDSRKHPTSLFHLQPHLEILYGREPSGDQKHKEYIEQVSYVYFSVPVEFLKEKLKAEGRDAARTYQVALEPIVITFFEKIAQVRRNGVLAQALDEIRERLVLYLAAVASAS